MRQRKLRGHNRIHRQIEKWRASNLKIDPQLLQNKNRDHVKIIVHPFCDLSIINSTIPDPKLKTKTLIVNGLLDIYDSWKEQLDATGMVYYLKIWLFEKRFSDSQVVCAVRDWSEFYNNTFNISPEQFNIDPSRFGNLNGRIDNYTWQLHLDEDFYTNNEVGDPIMYKSVEEYEDYKRWFKKRLKKKHKTEQLSDGTDTYIFYRGKVWLGSKD